jgi:deoxyribose-phosphate aldolase
MDRMQLAAMIDQTMLRPTVGHAAAATWIEANRDAGFASLCVSPFLVPLTAQLLAGSRTKVCTVVGFPLGYSCTETKAEEARLLVTLGAREIDMVMNVAALLEGDEAMVVDDVAAVVDSVGHILGEDGLVKVILETGHLSGEQIAIASRLAVAGGADFVKTSTGFGPRGASVDDVAIMRKAVGPAVGVKAAGGIRDLAATLAMIEAGATRIGTSSGLEVLAAFAAAAGDAASR